MLLGIVPLFIFLHQPPKHQDSARVSGLCLSATNDVTTPRFVLIILLDISLWSNCFGRIVDCIALIALIALFWPYCWSYLFDFRAWKYFLLLVSFSLTALQTASGSKWNLPPWWIMHLHLIIQRDPSAYIEPLDYLELRLDLLP